MYRLYLLALIPSIHGKKAYNYEVVGIRPSKTIETNTCRQRILCLETYVQAFPKASLNAHGLKDKNAQLDHALFGRVISVLDCVEEAGDDKFVRSIGVDDE